MYVVPRETQRFIVRYGGKNPFAFPNWRLIVAADVLVKESGVWRDWDEGLSTAERGGLNFSPCKDIVGMNFRPYDNKPMRTVVGVRETPKYPHLDGWILERWKPATEYGSREEWHSYKAADGVTPMLGPYPEEGDYEMIFGPWEKIPTTDVLQKYISMHVQQIASKRGTPESRAQEYLLRYQYKQQQEEQKRIAEYNAMMRDHLTPMHSSSLGASRWRNELAVNAGIQGHIGIL